MPIPDYQTLMLPVLQLASDGEEHSLREAVEQLAGTFKLTDEERLDLLPSGRQPTFDNRVGWARTYLKKAGLLHATRRGHFKISDRGREALAAKPKRINVKFLEQYPEFVAFRALRREKTEKPSDAAVEASGTADEATPEEAMEAAYQRLREELAAELLETVKGCTPAFFEQLVVDLVVRMGYGGTRKDAGQALGKSGDGGIDGIIKEDRLGLDVIYLQAKRWESTVGRPEIQKFAGALQGQRARKGIFITTAGFSKEAREFASSIDTKISLIDGDDLTQLMIDHDVGVSKTASYEMKRLDSDYFVED